MATAIEHRESTMFLDVASTLICVGDYVRSSIDEEFSQRTHGKWVIRRVAKAPGGYVLSYVLSDKGQILPDGYTGAYMHDVLPKGDEHDERMLVFTQVPVQVMGWEILPEETVNELARTRKRFGAR